MRVNNFAATVATVYFTSLVLGYQLNFFDENVVRHFFQIPMVRWFVMAAAGYAATQDVPACAIGIGLLALTLRRQSEHEARRNAPPFAPTPARPGAATRLSPTPRPTACLDARSEGVPEDEGVAEDDRSSPAPCASPPGVFFSASRRKPRGGPWL